MPTLKEIKGRLASVKSTKKITSAMKMVASAKLHKAQGQIERFLPYEHKLADLLSDFLSAYNDDKRISSVFAEVRPVKRVALVVLASNASLCGAFNSNIIRLFNERVKHYHELPCEIEIYPIGKKIEAAVRRLTFPVETKGSYMSLMDKPDFVGAAAIADTLMQDFRDGKIDRVDLIYNHYRSAGLQIPTTEQFLPIDLSSQQQADAMPTDYIIEPDRNTLIESLIPFALRSKIYAMLLDASAAEHGARTTAMQIATDNADEILDDLTLQYNNKRQQAITNELLDIIGGSEGQK